MPFLIVLKLLKCAWRKLSCPLKLCTRLYKTDICKNVSSSGTILLLLFWYSPALAILRTNFFLQHTSLIIGIYSSTLEKNDTYADVESLQKHQKPSMWIWHFAFCIAFRILDVLQTTSSYCMCLSTSYKGTYPGYTAPFFLIHLQENCFDKKT